MKEKITIGYKFIKEDMRSKNGDREWKLGKWYKHGGEIKICNSGFHASPTPLESLEYIYGDRWFIVEAKGHILKDGDKFVASEMRLTKEIDVKAVALRFACISARYCLKNYEDKYPNEKTVRQAIEAAESYIKHPTEVNRLKAKQTESAAWSAARSAARSAESAFWSAESAARSAESAFWSAESAFWSAESAGSAARSAARSAGSAAWSAESAFWSAESAARSAGSAARSAARSAGSAARSAAKEHLNFELEKLIKNHIKK